MATVTPLNYNTVQFAIRNINQILLRNEGGILLRCTVDKHNDIVGVDFVSVQDALNCGLDNLVELTGKK